MSANPQAIRIVVASGKGGTGKTTVATSLALSLARLGTVRFYDCDVEAPNAHLFLKPDWQEREPAVIMVPEIDAQTCSLCGTCVEVCQFHALAKIASTIMVFPQLCHGCGSCTWNCPEGAIHEVPNPIGELSAGMAGARIYASQGDLTIGEPMATPIIRQLKRWKPDEQAAVQIYDAPPGASCPVVETLQGADFALLVTEATPFGMHDLKQIVGILTDLSIPAGIIINRDGIGSPQIESEINALGIPVLMRIPYDAAIAAGLAAGRTLVDIQPQQQAAFEQLFNAIQNLLEVKPHVH